jgi:hypothetical protein
MVSSNGDHAGIFAFRAKKSESNVAICDIKTPHQTHGLLARVCDLKICSGFRASMTSNVFVTSPLRLTGSRRRPALSLIAQITGKLISPFIQDSIRASFVEETLTDDFENRIKESLSDIVSDTHSKKTPLAAASPAAERDGVRVSFIHINRAVTFFKALTRFWLWTPYATEA